MDTSRVDGVKAPQHLNTPRARVLLHARLVKLQEVHLPPVVRVVALAVHF